MSAGLALGSVIRAGAVICRVGDHPVVAPFEGALRGLLPDGCAVTQGLKIGDLDPRADPALCRLVSDKALAIGGGVLEAILARPMLRRALFSA
jgi:xanthine dehydrogenase accessory factor